MSALYDVASAQIEAYCYAGTCRRVRAWARLLQTVPVYRCLGGCGTAREFSVIEVPGFGARARPAAGTQVITRRPTHYSKQAQEVKIRSGSKPTCGCCHARAFFKEFSVVFRCGCDPHARTCPTCSRGGCHCRCRKTVPRYDDAALSPLTEASAPGPSRDTRATASKHTRDNRGRSHELHKGAARPATHRPILMGIGVAGRAADLKWSPR